MEKRKMAFWSVAILAVFILAGCGSNKGSGGSGTSGEATLPQAQTLGIDNCAKCHNPTSPEMAEWLTSAHANPSHIGYPIDSTCVACHDPQSDGERMPEALAAEDARPVIGCEACHGGGQYHSGMGPLPYARPEAEQCGSCHAEIPGSHLKYHPEADNIITDYQASPHARSMNDHIWADEDQTEARARCSKCHTDEGAKQYKDLNGDHDQLVAAFDGKADVSEPTAAQCRTCHEAHSSELLFAADELVPGSAEFNTCVSCHGLNNADGSLMDHYHDPAVNGYGALGEIITDTHFDDPATVDVIEGYVVNSASERACRDCHNVHAADNTINEQWARSGHAGGIAQVKAAAAEGLSGEELSDAVKAAGVTDEVASAWSHYPWTADERAGCVECHTATGAAAFLDFLKAGNAPADFDPSALYDADGKFPHITMERTQTGVDYKGDPVYSYAKLQKEVLSCSGCHSNNAGGLRNPGAVTSKTGLTFPDFANSNLCVNCHGGRSTGANVVNKFVNTHYLPAAGVLTAQNGYEYAGQNYADVAYFAHAGIGLEEAEDGSMSGSGPCAGCHMSGAEGHTFEVVAKDEEGVITAINTEACASCHAGDYALTAEKMEAEAEGYHESLEILQAALTAQSINYLGGYPYFSVADWADPDGDGTPQFDAAMSAGAATNFGLFHHEPGGYAHNRYYAKRLIFDSIDYIVDGSLDGTITIDAVTYPEAAHWLSVDDGGVATRP